MKSFSWCIKRPTEGLPYLFLDMFIDGVRVATVSRNLPSMNPSVEDVAKAVSDLKGSLGG